MGFNSAFKGLKLLKPPERAFKLFKWPRPQRVKPRCEGMQRLAKWNLRQAWNFDWRRWGGNCCAAWVQSADLMHQTGLRFCGRVTARYWKASVSFNSAWRSCLRNAMHLRTAFDTAIPNVFVFLFLYECYLVTHWIQTRGNQTRYLILWSKIVSFVLFVSCHGCVRTVWSIHSYALEILLGFFIRICVCLLQMKTSFETQLHW